MHELQRIEIEGYRSIKSLDLDLRGINVLIGPNAAGKSNFVRFFRLLHQLVDENLQVHVRQSGDADSLLYYGAKTTSSLRGELQIGPNIYLFELTSTEDDRLIFKQERVLFEEHQEPKPLVGRGHEETFVERVMAPHSGPRV